MNELFQQIADNPLAAMLVIGNLVLIESLLSVDNAAVLATMVLALPKDQRSKALKYGILGAYFFRGVSLFLASYLVKIWWLKGVGGLYLLYLTFDWWRKRNDRQTELTEIKTDGNAFYRATAGRLGKFWATVFAVEVMDLAFSIDNVFAAVAISRNILLIIFGVFIGILAMRFVAQGFVKLMEHYPFLEGCAYFVIAILGLKLSLSVVGHFFPEAQFSKILESPTTDWVTSAVTVGVFFFPLVTCAIFDFPKKNRR